MINQPAEPQPEVLVYLPAPGAATDIATGSGIVGFAPADGRIQVYYEGNLYNAANLQTFAECIQHAADRMLARYPTVATSSLPADDLVEVGVFNPSLGEVFIYPEKCALVEAWIGAPLDVAQSQLDSPRHELTRMGFGPEITNWSQAVNHAVRRPQDPASQRLLHLLHKHQQES